MNPAASWAVTLAKVSKRDWLDPILDQLPVGFIIIKAPAGRVLAGNRQLERIFRHPVRYSLGVADYGEWVGYHSDGRPYAPGEWPIARALDGEVTRGEEVEVERGDGARGFISIDAAPIRDEAGTIIAALAVIQDVTDRKLLEQRERRTAQRLRNVLENTTDCVFVLDRAWRFTYLNARAAAEIAGGRDLIGHNIWEAFPEAVHGPFWPVYHNAMEEHLAGSVEAFYKPLGQWYEAHARPSEEGIAVFFRNITAAKTAAETQRRSDQGLRTALRAARCVAFEWTLATGHTARSDNALEVLGIGSGTADEFFQHIHPDDRPSAEQALRQAYASGAPEDVEVRFIRPDGTQIWLNVSTQAEFDESGKPVRVFGIDQDITERKQAELSLRLRDQALAATSHGMIITDATQPDNPIIFVNPAFEQITGYPAEEALGRNCRFLQGPGSEQAAIQQMRLAVAGGRAFEGTITNYRKDGTHFTNEISISPVHDKAGRLTHFVGAQTDATPRQRIEEQLRQSQKMEAIGQLTGGVAHDFNNLLSVILGNTEILAEEIEDPELQRLARMAEESASRAAELTQKLLAFGRRQTLKPEPVDLDEVVHGMVGLLRRTLGEPVEIRLVTKGSQSAALTDRTLFESALLNLAVNARDAMPKGGMLTITTGERLARHDDGLVPVGQPVVFVTVADTGIGMAPDVVTHAFEPFFTTKDVGQGTGLGLAMVYGFAQQSGGHVSIASREGEGTAVTIVLRAVGKETERQPEVETGLPRRGTGRVLVVEDEPSVRQFVEVQLKSLGYEVVCTSMAKEALDLLEKDVCFDLLFTDVVLPQGISGVELSRLADAKCPGLRVLLTSGYSEDVFMQHGRPKEGTLLLRKPYRRRELAETLRRVLDTGTL